MLPKLEMTHDKVALLIRSALLDDAANIAERLAVLTAEIDVDEDEICISISDELWPENKQTPATDAIASSFMLTIEWAGRIGDFPFAWPGLAEHAKTTKDYVWSFMDAYAGRQSGPKK